MPNEPSLFQPCAVAGMFGCAPMNSTYDYWKNGVPWEGESSFDHWQLMYMLKISSLFDTVAFAQAPPLCSTKSNIEWAASGVVLNVRSLER